MQEIKQGMGPGGFCICTKCDHKISHQPGVPCKEQKCPQCGSKMVREGSYHHQLIEKKRRKK